MSGMHWHEPARLVLTVARDHDGECRVTACMASGGFSGVGTDYFESSALSGFAEALVRLSESGFGTAKLVGGREDPYLSIAVAPHGRRGHCLVSTNLVSTPIVRSEPASVRHVLTAALQAEPAGLLRFARALQDIPLGGRAEATLEGMSAA